MAATANPGLGEKASEFQSCHIIIWIFSFQHKIMQCAKKQKISIAYTRKKKSTEFESEVAQMLDLLKMDLK